jgi:ABC-type nitrate/sulfonate/bicarbonate transport system substrate-binding protein
MKRTALLAVAAFALATPAVAQQEEVTLALPAQSMVFSPLYIADVEGLWTKHGLKVRPVDITGIGSFNAMISRSVEFTSSSGPTIIRAFTRGQKSIGIGSTLDGLPIELVMRKDVAQAAGVTADSPVEKRAAALKDKTIGLAAPNTIVHAYVRYFAKKGGINPERDIKIATMVAEANLAGLRANAIDGFMQGPPWPSLAMAQGNAMVLSSPMRGDLMELRPHTFNLIITRPGYCDEKPANCTKMMAGVHDAMVMMHDDPKRAVAALAKRFPAENMAAFEDSYKGVLALTPRSTLVKEQGMKNSQDLMVVGGMLKEDEKLASFTELYTNKFAK